MRECQHREERETKKVSVVVVLGVVLVASVCVGSIPPFKKHIQPLSTLDLLRVASQGFEAYAQSDGYCHNTNTYDCMWNDAALMCVGSYIVFTDPRLNHHCHAADNHNYCQDIDHYNDCVTRTSYECYTCSVSLHLCNHYTAGTTTRVYQWHGTDFTP